MRVTTAALQQGRSPHLPGDRPCSYLSITDDLMEDTRMTSINILIGAHLTIILCLLLQLGD